ncbi:MAG: tRNA (adenosine(37)-N6)-threonylcarbamoyltransferase complex ATPase subunit type 1 TsaE, partial [Planctomycetota bacterium]
MSEVLHRELASLEDTKAFAVQLAKAIDAEIDSAFTAITVAFTGTLGTGKTQTIRFMAEAWGVPAEEVTSPTYVLLQRYSARRPIYHFDYYRLGEIDEVWDLGIDELFEQPNIVLIEWAERFPQSLPEDYLHVTLEPASDGRRRMKLAAIGTRSNRICS